MTPPPPSLLSRLSQECILHHILPLLDLPSLRQLSFTCVTLNRLVCEHLSTGSALLLPSPDFRRRLKEVHLRSISDLTSCLRVLDLSGCADGVTNSILRDFIHHNPSLEHLNISKCYRVTSAAFAGLNECHGSLSRPLSHLETFIANWCRNLNGEWTVSLSHCPLRSISLAGTWYTNDETINDIVTFFSNLECININKCYKISDEGVRRFVFCKNLRILKISGCFKIGDKSVGAVLEECSRTLRQVAMDDCRSISRRLLDKISERGLLLLEAKRENADEMWDASDRYMKQGFLF